MKNYTVINRILSFFLCLIVVIVSTFTFSVPVYASDGVYPAGTSWWEKFREETTTYLVYLACRVGAVVDHDFAQWYQTREDYVEWWNTDHISRLEDSNGEITYSFDADLINQIKQALKEYQDEKYGYQILPTLKYDQIPVSVFANARQYRSFCELVKTNKIIGYSCNKYRLAVYDVSPYVDGTSGLYISTYYAYDGVNTPAVRLMGLISWDYTTTTYYELNLSSDDDILTSWEDCKTYVENHTDDVNTYSRDSVSNSFLITDSRYNGVSPLVSYSGSDVLVFNSATSLKNYSVDKRGVFTTSGFYEDTGALTVKLDDLNNSIGDLTSLLDQFKDLIGKQEGSLTEDQLQQLLKEFLDDFFNRLDNPVTPGGDIDIPDGFFDSIAGYCNSVLAYLESIVYEIQNLEFLTWESNIDDEEHSDLLDMLDKIWDDPETGSQEVADELSMSFSDLATGMTKKFPFSIPWDVYALFTVFADIDPPQTYGISSYSLESDGIQPLSEGDMEEHNAPYFELPIVLESYGINESIKVDLEPFTPVSTLSRTMLSLLFGVFLMKFTIKIIDLFKGGTDT